MSDKKTVLQNFLDWLRLNQEENSDAIEKVLSMIELEKFQIEDSFHQAQLEMISVFGDYIGIKHEADIEDREDAERYYKTRYMFNDNVIGKNNN